MKHDLQIDNHTLVEECLKGDKEALNLFYVRFSPRMLGVIRRYVQDPNDAEDILHDGFIVAFTRLDSLRDFNSVDYWLASIMKNLAIQFLQEQSVSGILHEIPEVEDTPDIDDFINLDVLEKLMKKLPDGYQKVFRLAVLENKSHKEIGKLLGIAPNSSSSQLFHAKLMMRKLISDYRRQTGALIVLLACLSTWLVLHFSKSPETGHEGLVAEVKVEHKAPAAMPVTEVDSHNHDIVAKPHSVPESKPAAQPETPAQSEPAAQPESLTEAVTDTVGTDGTSMEITPASRPGVDSVAAVPEVLYAEVVTGRRGSWSLGLGVDPGLFGANISSSIPDAGLGWNPGTDIPGNDDDEDKQELQRSRAIYRAHPRDVSHKNHLPVTVAVTLNRNLSSVIGVESGLVYNYLRTTFATENTEGTGKWHYLGIPLKLNVRLCNTGRLGFYTSVGARVDIPLHSGIEIERYKYNNPEFKPGSFHSPVMFTAGASVGVSLRLSGKSELFLEPTVNYHFNRHYNVPNQWTDNPLDFSLPLGIRFNW